MNPYAFVPDQGHKEERMNLCVLPRPVNPYALRPGTVDSLPCENCGHPAMYRLEALP